MAIAKPKPSMPVTATARIVEGAIQKAPKTVSLGVLGLLVGSFLAGKKGAIILGLAGACLGFYFED